MNKARLIGWLLLIGLLLGSSLWLSRELLKSRTAAGPVVSRQDQATADPEAVRLAAVEASLQARQPLASRCLQQALRGLGLQPSEWVPLLVIITGADCAADCPSEAEAQRLVDEYRLEGVQVMLIRTAIRDYQTPSPAGVPTITVAGCAELVAEHGDDYLLRLPDGRLDSSGHRHEAMLRRPPPKDPQDEPEPAPAFTPEKVLRAALARD